MALKTVGNLKDSVAGILQGTNLDNVTNLNGVLERGARVLAQQADVPESSGRQNYMFYDMVTNYPAPSTIFGGALVDIRPQGVDRLPSDIVIKRPIELFDRTKTYIVNGYEVTFEWNMGVGTMRVAQNKAQQAVILDGMSDASSWTPSGGITTLYDDTSTFYSEPGSIRFNLPSTGAISKTLSTPIDLENYEGVASVFLAMRLPATDLTSVTLRLGSSSTNYVEVTQTTGFLGAWQASDFQLTQFDLSTATTTGTPDFTNLDYLYLSFVPSTAMVNVRVGNLFAAQPSAHQVLFQSSAIFLSNGTLSNTISNDDDEIVLNDAAYTLLEYIEAWEIAQQNGAQVAQVVLDRIQAKLYDKDIGLVPKYRTDNPSEELRQIGSYYDGTDY